MSIRVQYRKPADAWKPTHERCLALCGVLRAGNIPAVPYQGSVYAQCTRAAWLEATLEHAWLRIGAVVHSEED